MPSENRPKNRSPSPRSRHESPEDVTSDHEREAESGDQEDEADTQKEQEQVPKSPAYVAPIPEIGSISPVSAGIQISQTDRPNIPPFIGDLLVGKQVDCDGDIVDPKSGQVLARAGGDLPSIIGRPVSNAQGDILGDSGELLGYVADIELGREQGPPTGPPRSLFDLMGRARSSLMVDQEGNIIDGPSGNVVGKFHDNNNPLHRKEKEEREARERAQKQKEPASAAQETETPQDEERSPPPTQPSPPPPPPQQEQSQSQSTGDGQQRPRRTEEERRQNAAEWRKENPNESPSDIFLDVKSTREGIQLTIRIPTVFNGQQTTPHISFS